jgi:NAD-dependent dihydropyrimidine dehydrogenase PreA subunit
VSFVITEGCVDVMDKACTEVCPVDCIYPGGRMLYIHPDECIDCGACESACPQEAVVHQDDVEPQPIDFLAVAKEFFVPVGSPGGANEVDLSATDHPLVAALPAASR